jgi:hypothetical protein
MIRLQCYESTSGKYFMERFRVLLWSGELGMSSVCSVCMIYIPVLDTIQIIDHEIIFMRVDMDRPEGHCQV